MTTLETGLTVAFVVHTICIVWLTLRCQYWKERSRFGEVKEQFIKDMFQAHLERTRKREQS